LIHIGRDQRPAGRHGEPPSRALAESIRDLGFTMGRLKTGTPPRLHRRSIDFKSCVERGVFSEREGDASPVAFSFESNATVQNRVSCWMLHTTDRVHALVRDHVAESPLFNGQIRGIGPATARRSKTR
jgi:tRNA uridine 5-carboxymethylaminomethyl modification enzyme